MPQGAYRTTAFDAIERIAALTSLPDISGVLSTTLASFGFTSVVVSGLPPQTDDAIPVIVLDGAPKGWIENYLREGFYRDDHLAAHALTTTEPFVLTDAPIHPTNASGARRFIEARESFGIPHGLVVPTGRPTNIPSCFSVSGPDPDLQLDAQRAVQVIAFYAVGKIRTLLRPADGGDGRERLTQHEREVLQWTAAGKTSWEISHMQGVSEAAVNRVIARAMVKLGAVTRTQAVVHAIRCGEIEL